MEERWWSLRKTSALVYVEYGGTFATLPASGFEMQKGPPVRLRLNLENSLRGRDPDEDAQALAESPATLTRLELTDEHVISRLRLHLPQSADVAPGWRLVVILRGRHEFDAEREWRQDGALVLRVVAGP